MDYGLPHEQTRDHHLRTLWRKHRMQGKRQFKMPMQYGAAEFERGAVCK
jgi:hypothetical protein